jgi:hypothetical protein
MMATSKSKDKVRQENNRHKRNMFMSIQIMKMGFVIKTENPSGSING